MSSGVLGIVSRVRNSATRNLANGIVKSVCSGRILIAKPRNSASPRSSAHFGVSIVTRPSTSRPLNLYPISLTNPDTVPIRCWRRTSYASGTNSVLTDSEQPGVGSCHGDRATAEQEAVAPSRDWKLGTTLHRGAPFRPPLRRSTLLCHAR